MVSRQYQWMQQHKAQQGLLCCGVALDAAGDAVVPPLSVHVICCDADANLKTL